MRKRLTAMLMALSFAALVAPSSTASAYCDPQWESGDCSNSCMDTARLYHRITGRPAPWYCPM